MNGTFGDKSNFRRSPEVNVSDLLDRIKEHSHETLIILTGVMKSITVANAAYALGALVTADISPTLWIPYWLASFLAIIATYTGQMTNSLIVAYDPDWRETGIMFSQTVWEFLLMSALMPRDGAIPMLHWWYLVLTMHATFGFLALTNVARKVSATAYSAALSPMVNCHLIELRRGQLASGIISVVSLLVWWAVQFCLFLQPRITRWQVLYPVLQIGVLVGVIRVFENERANILNFIRSRRPE